MRIKRIEIIGFKSFFDKTVLHINEPITAVVGPNGCGKSNIIDAIRWCMGEQSAKHLRGKSMEDVIFNGSETRAASGMAEVSLTFEDVSVHNMEEDREDAEIDEEDILAEGKPSIDFSQYGEVTISRRLFRDGTSDYFLNKTPCRLRDITDFFLGTGVGTKAYSIIEQGRVGMIVSAKAEERRLIIEEAAGITKFKKKKQAAERKMEQTRQNLVRVTDIVSEIDKQLGSLRRQAQKAERYKRYRAEVKDIELWSASHRWLGLRAEELLLRGEHEERVQQRDAAHHELEMCEAGITAERAEQAVEERRLADLTQVVFDLENRVKLGESQIDFQTREAKDLEERVIAAGGEIHELSREREAGEAEGAEIRAESARLEEEAGARQAELGELEAALAGAREALAQAQAELDAARAEIGKAQADIARHENNLRSLERRRSDLALRDQRIAEEERRAEARHGELAAEIDTHEGKLDGLRQLRLELAEKKGSLEERLETLSAEHATNETRVEALRAELGRRRERRKALREIQDRYEGFARGTRAIMLHRASEVRGLVADLLRADPDVEPAVEAVLGERLGALLVSSHEVGVGAVEFLKRRSEGRASFIPAGGFPAAPAVEAVVAEGVRGPLIQFVRCADGVEGMAEYLLGDVLLVESLPRALELLCGGVRRSMVTLEGDLVDAHGTITGGSRDAVGAGVLAQKREIRELDDLVDRLEAEHAEAATRHTTCKQELERVRLTLDALHKDSHQGEITILAHEKDLTRWRSEAERLAERRTQLARDRAELDAALVEHARESEDTQVALGDARGRADDAERRQLGLIEGVTVARGAVDDAAARVTEHKVRVAQIQAERAAVRQQLGRNEEQLRELARRIERLEQSAAEARERAAGLRDEAGHTAAELVGLREERRARAEELAAGRAVHEQRLAELQVAELGARNLRAQAEKLSGEASRLELRLGQIDADHRHLHETIAERYRVSLAREIIDHHLRPPVGDAEEARLRELRELIERMGEINLTAIEEFEELSKRNDFLVAQKQDLESALGQLERAIAKINKTSRKRFRETFEQVNAKFQEVFPRLFRGGRAELRLVAPASPAGTPVSDGDLLDAGIEIFAQPPGKKIVTVDSLSGGEKALTAVSLIFAIFLIKPSPFCILDEVDAPLDEANVGRYNELVREMTDRSQFIVITHNKRTMEIADSLYGITMEEPGCSKLVNVNLKVFAAERKAA